MAVESADDRAAFLTDFGEAATWTVGAVTSSITVLPYSGSVRVDRGDGLSFLSQGAAFTCRSADVPAGAEQGDGVGFLGGSYEVESIEPDGTGMTLVRLRKG